METKTIAEQFPWAVVGAEAYTYQASGWGVSELRKVTITKVTKSRITTGDTRTFYVRKYGTELTELGREYYRSPVLIAVDDPRVAEARVEARKRKIADDARSTTDAFNRSRTVENAQAAVAALTAFIEDNKEEGK